MPILSFTLVEALWGLTGRAALSLALGYRGRSTPERPQPWLVPPCMSLFRVQGVKLRLFWDLEVGMMAYSILQRIASASRGRGGGGSASERNLQAPNHAQVSMAADHGVAECFAASPPRAPGPA